MEPWQPSVPADPALRPDVLLDPTAWAEQPFGSVELGDRRRTRRLVRSAAALAAEPDRSWSERTRDPAALKAVYRLLDTAAVTCAGLLAPHQAQTRASLADEPVTLLVQDTTVVDYSHHPATTGLAPIGDGRGRGYLLQTVLAVRPEPRQVLGILHAAPWRREPAPRRRHARAQRRTPAPPPRVGGVGAGGDRDRGKRLLMGQAAAAHADVVTVTDDNPRSEDPAAIRAAVLAGCPDATEVGDRAEAILRAVAALQPGDALLIAGKGHETGQTVGGVTYPFDDAEQASLAVAALDGGA